MVIIAPVDFQKLGESMPRCIEAVRATPYVGVPFNPQGSSPWFYQLLLQSWPVARTQEGSFVASLYSKPTTLSPGMTFIVSLSTLQPIRYRLTPLGATVYVFGLPADSADFRKRDSGYPDQDVL